MQQNISVHRVAAAAGEAFFPAFVEIDIESNSPLLMTETEIDYFFDCLQDAADKARAEAKARLKG